MYPGEKAVIHPDEVADVTWSCGQGLRKLLMLLSMTVRVGMQFLHRVCQEGTHAEVTSALLVNVANNENVAAL